MISEHVFRWQENEDWGMKHYCKKWMLPHQWYGTLKIMLKWWGHIEGMEYERLLKNMLHWLQRERTGTE
jgi:hypothetical protein